MKGIEFPSKAPIRVAIRVIKEVHSIVRHLEIQRPLLNQSLRGGDFDLVDHGIKNEQLIVAHGSDIISWKESDG